MEKLHPLNEFHVNRKHIIINRLYIFLTGISLATLFYYRITSIYRQITTQQLKSSVVFSHVLIFVSEIILSFTWALRQAAKWRPVKRSVFPENLPEDSKLPSIDVFICTADPNKEPSFDVMNTVISALALDYPLDKLHVYVSDDGGSRVTLMAIRETWKFAKLWIVFCNKFRVSIRCPKAYFSAEGCCDDSCQKSSDEKYFVAEKSEIKRRYEEFKDSLEKIVAETGTTVSRDHSSTIEVINRFDLEKERLPLLVYVAREKRPFHHHNFKAGTLNVLLRVSAMISNSPYILTLDCDMFCNDPSSARQAMCFLFDSKLSSENNNTNLSFVQFPQAFYNVRSETDIYDGSIREIWEEWKGLDGLEGPIISGTGFYIKRKSLYGPPKFKEDANLIELQKSFGSSNEFVKSISGKHRQKLADDDHCDIEGLLAKELQLLASCNYEHDTKWGKEVGFRYFSLVEDYFTSLNLHCQGWTSVYVDPPNPCFLGSSPRTLNDVLVQHGRWCVGLLQVCLSKYSPLMYGPKKISILLSMGYARCACVALYSPALYALAVVPQLCLLKGIALYPEVSSPYFILFPMIFITSQIKHIQEITLSKSHSIRMWRNELRMWMMKSLTSYTYAILETIKEKTGLGEALFLPTNKSVDEEQALRYEEGVYDFQAPPVFMVPLCSLYMLNAASLIFGFSRIFKDGFYEDAMSAQIFIALFVVVLNFPLLEGMVLRHDKGRVSSFVTIVSAAICGIILLLASVC